MSEQTSEQGSGTSAADASQVDAEAAAASEQGSGTEVSNAPLTTEGGAAERAAASVAPLSGVAPDKEPDCPACGAGYLFAIGKTADGTLVFCFHCQRGMSVPDEGEIPAPAIAGIDGPTALQPTHEQVATMTQQTEGHPVADVHSESARGTTS